MNDELKTKLDKLYIPEPSSNFEYRIISAARDNRKPQSSSEVIKTAFNDFFSGVASSFKPIALAVCAATIALTIFSKDNFHPTHNTMAVKSVPAQVSNDEDSLDDFALFDEDDFLFDADWII